MFTVRELTNSKIGLSSDFKGFDSFHDLVTWMLVCAPNVHYQQISDVDYIEKYAIVRYCIWTRWWEYESIQV